jgi:hypothetical protein
MLQWLSKNRIFKTATLLGVILVAVFLFSNNVFAQSVADQTSQLQQGVKIIQQPLGLGAFDIRLIIANIIRAALGLIGIVLVILMLYAGYLWMTAGGNEEQIGQSKSIIRNAVIGLAIILSAYSIVAYIMNILGVKSGAGVVQTTVQPPGTQNFVGSGALGKVIKEHYPVRDQKDVPRNTKIVVTFNKPVLLSSFVDDINGNKIFGDCVDMDKPDFDWFIKCDHIKIENNKLVDKYINVIRSNTGESIKGLVITAIPSTIKGVTGIYTIVLKPVTTGEGGYLGSKTESLEYTVHLGDGILSDDATNNNPSIFQSKNIGNNFYSWQFTTGNFLDTTPPHVVAVFPDSVIKNPNGEPKNSVIQVSFNEAIDPIGVQGLFKAVNGQTYFALSDNKVFLKSDKSSLPLGNFSLVNNYTTLEFTPSLECGKNACGNPIYCLPVCDVPGANCKSDSYQILIKAAKTLAGSFESQPFTGVVDLAGNALDGNNDGVVQTATTTLPVFDKWKTPDNYYWTFKLNDQIDKTSPYLSQITPGVTAENVPKDAAWVINFSKRMRVEPLYGIGLEEYPSPADNIPLWKMPFVHLNYQTVEMKHGPFLDKKNQFYMPVITSAVEDVNFNCFYPGIGPNDQKLGNNLDSKICDPSQPGNTCCGVKDLVGSEFCCNGQAIAAKDGAVKCVSNIKNTYQPVP